MHIDIRDLQILTNDSSPLVVEYAYKALRFFNTPEVTEIFLEGVKNDDMDIRKISFSYLLNQSHVDITAILICTVYAMQH